MSSRSQASHVDEVDTIVGMPAVDACASSSEPNEAPPPKNSECRALFVRRPPRPAPRPAPAPRLKAVPSSGPPPLPIAAKTADPTAPIAANDTRTMEIDPACIEEVRAIAAVERARPPTQKQPMKHARALDLARNASRSLVTLLRATAFFALYAASAASAWLRAAFFPATRAVVAAAKARLLVEWKRASASARQ